MKKLLLPLAGALLIISGLSGCQSTELVSGLPTPSVVTESTAADSAGEPGATSENSEADGQIRLSAITSGGSQAVFFKVNTLGAESFLDTIRDTVERFAPGAY